MAPRPHVTVEPDTEHVPRSVVAATFVNPDGTTSTNDTPAASDGPQLPTSRVYVTEFPATRGDGATEADTLISALAVPITPVDLAVLLLVTGSVVADDTLAVWEILAPAVAEGLVCATTVKLTDAPAARLATVHDTSEAVCREQAGLPVPGVTDTSDIAARDPESTTSVTVTVPTASDGPLFVAVTVYVCC